MYFKQIGCTQAKFNAGVTSTQDRRLRHSIAVESRGKHRQSEMVASAGAVRAELLRKEEVEALSLRCRLCVELAQDFAPFFNEKDEMRKVGQLISSSSVKLWQGLPCFFST